MENGKPAYMEEQLIARLPDATVQCKKSRQQSVRRWLCEPLVGAVEGRPRLSASQCRP